jgi:hypothetical protein
LEQIVSHLAERKIFFVNEISKLEREIVDQTAKLEALDKKLAEEGI